MNFKAVRVRLKRSARAVQLSGRLAIVETHTLWYFGHHCCFVVGFDALGIWHFWIFTLFHPFLLFCAHSEPHSLLEYNLFTVLRMSNDLRQNRFPRGADEHHTCPRGKHGCAIKFHFSESEQNVLP